MLNFKKKKENKYLYMIPIEDELAKWEVIDQEELNQRVQDNLLEESGRLFKIEQEINIRFEENNLFGLISGQTEEPEANSYDAAVLQDKTAASR